MNSPFQSGLRALPERCLPESCAGKPHKGESLCVAWRQGAVWHDSRPLDQHLCQMIDTLAKVVEIPSTESSESRVYVLLALG